MAKPELQQTKASIQMPETILHEEITTSCDQNAISVVVSPVNHQKTQNQQVKTQTPKHQNPNIKNQNLMRKLSLLAGLFAVMALSSCKKDYTCECTYSNGILGTETESHEINDSKKDDAESACDAIEATYAGNDATCDLK